MANVIPSDTVAAGMTGHISDHNNIADVLTALQASAAVLPGFSWGTATLVNGTVAVALPAVDAGDVILVSRMTPSGTLGHLSVPTVSPGTGFTITSSSAAENSVVGYLVLG